MIIFGPPFPDPPPLSFDAKDASCQVEPFLMSLHQLADIDIGLAEHPADGDPSIEAAGVSVASEIAIVSHRWPVDGIKPLAAHRSAVIDPGGSDPFEPCRCRCCQQCDDQGHQDYSVPSHSPHLPLNCPLISTILSPDRTIAFCCDVVPSIRLTSSFNTVDIDKKCFDAFGVQPTYSRSWIGFWLEDGARCEAQRTG